MRIIFKQLNDKDIRIIGINEETLEEKEVGCIFTPSSSSNNIKNAIQVCGIVSAFDYWGCARYRYPKYTEENLSSQVKKRILDKLENNNEKMVQAKDIQLVFSLDTKREFSEGNCFGCYNTPCSCENKGNHKHISPYNIQREEDLNLEKENDRKD